MNKFEHNNIDWERKLVGPTTKTNGKTANLKTNNLALFHPICIQKCLDPILLPFIKQNTSGKVNLWTISNYIKQTVPTYTHTFISS